MRHHHRTGVAKSHRGARNGLLARHAAGHHAARERALSNRRRRRNRLMNWLRAGRCGSRHGNLRAGAEDHFSVAHPVHAVGRDNAVAARQFMDRHFANRRVRRGGDCFAADAVIDNVVVRADGVIVDHGRVLKSSVRIIAAK